MAVSERVFKMDKADVKLDAVKEYVFKGRSIHYIRHRYDIGEGLPKLMYDVVKD